MIWAKYFITSQLNKRIRLWRVSLILVFGVWGLACGEESYTIKLEYPSKVGEKYRLRVRTSKKEQNRLSTAGRTNTLIMEMSVELEGQIEVLAVDSKGHETRIACTVEKFVATKGQEQKSLFKKGDKVVVQQQDGRSKYTVDGENVSYERIQALNLVLFLAETNNMSGEGIFRTMESKKVGDSWPIDAKAAMASFKHPDLIAAPKSLEGRCQLASVKMVRGKPYLEVSAIVTTDTIEVPPRPEADLRGHGSMEAHFLGLFSVGNIRRPAKESVSLKAIVTFDVTKYPSARSADALFELSSEREVED